MTNINPNQGRVTKLVTQKKKLTEAASQPPDMFDRESKFLSHLDKIVEWKNTGTTYPIQVNIDPTFKCNHRCPGCIGLMGQDLSTIPLDRFEALAEELGAVGVRTVVLGGGGDPSCHTNFAEILRVLNLHGIQIGYYTNGELLKEDTIEATVDTCEWVRFSLDADGPKIHQLVHDSSPKAFDKVVKNMGRLHEARVKAGREMVIGAGYLVRPDTMSGMYGASKLCREIGMDYIRIRPFFGYDNKPLCSPEEADRILEELARCEELGTDSFKVKYPGNRMGWVASGTPPITYKRCNVHHFITQIGGDAKVYLCCHTIGWEKYCLGDLNKQTFKEIWDSEERKKIFENIDYRDCPTPCHHNPINELLHKFEAETVHTDFI